MQAAAASMLELPLLAVPDFGAYEDAFERMGRFFQAYHIELVERPVGTIPRGYYFEVGLSTQGYEHIVICQEGRIVHDPNPHGRGIVQPHYVLELRLI